MTGGAGNRTHDWWTTAVHPETQPQYVHTAVRAVLFVRHTSSYPEIGHSNLLVLKGIPSQRQDKTSTLQEVKLGHAKVGKTSCCYKNVNIVKKKHTLQDIYWISMCM